ASLVDVPDSARLKEQLLSVDDGEPLLLESRQDRHLDDVDPNRLSGQPVLVYNGRHFSGDLLSDAGFRMERATQGGDPGTRSGPAGPRRIRDLAVVWLSVVVQPRVVELVMLGCRSEVPD